MSDSLLNSLPTLHGTMLSIIVGFVTAFALYAYQTTSSARQRLEEMKRQVQKTSGPDYRFAMNLSTYLNNAGKVDWKRCKDGLWDASMLFGHVKYEDNGLKQETIIIDSSSDSSEGFNRSDFIHKHGFKRDAVYIEKTQIEKAARETLGILSLVMTSYPYLGQGGLNTNITDDIESYRKWLDDLSRYNGYLMWLWNASHIGLVELMNQYRLLDIQRQKDLHEKNFQHNLEIYKEQGVDISEEEIQRIRKQFHTIHDIDYGLIIRDFFSKVIQIEQHIIPKAREHLIALTTYEKQFKLKTRAIWVLVSAVFIFVLGIITPLVISAYAKAPIVKSLEICLLLGTTAPYFFGLLYLICVVSRLKQP